MKAILHLANLHKRDRNLVITVLADVLELNSSRPSAGTMLTAKLDKASSKFLSYDLSYCNNLLTWWNNWNSLTRFREILQHFKDQYIYIDG